MVRPILKEANISLAKRESLPAKKFAIPATKAKRLGVAGEIQGQAKGKYPIDTPRRARNALARVSQFGTSGERAAVRQKVYSRYPGLREGFKQRHGGESPTAKENVRKVEQGGIAKAGATLTNEQLAHREDRAVHRLLREQGVRKRQEATRGLGPFREERRAYREAQAKARKKRQESMAGLGPMGKSASGLQFAAFTDEMMKISGVGQKVLQFINRPFAASELRVAKGFGPEEFARTFEKVKGQVGPEHAEKIKQKVTKTPWLHTTEWGSGRGRAETEKALAQIRAAKGAPA